MKSIGLHPSDTGKEGGNEIGQKMSDYIIPGGPFQQAYKELKKTGFKFSWQSLPPGEKKAAPISKVKYTCMACGLHAWAKPDIELICGECHAEQGIIEIMIADV